MFLFFPMSRLFAVPASPHIFLTLLFLLQYSVFQMFAVPASPHISFSTVPAAQCSCYSMFLHLLTFPSHSCSCYSGFQLFAVPASPHISFSLLFLLLSVPAVRCSCTSLVPLLIESGFPLIPTIPDSYDVSLKFIYIYIIYH